MNETYFFDSYAIYEILKGNKSYEKYLSADIILTKLNLFELYYGMLRDYNENAANKIFAEYAAFITDFDRMTIKLAAKLRLSRRKENLSMTDCIGYAVACQLGVKFLTGDRQFENKPNVEFVK